MTTPNAPHNDHELVARLFELLSEIDLDSDSDVDDFLRQMGLDPDQVATRMKGVAEKALQESTQNWRSRAPLEIEVEKQKLARHDSSRHVTKNRRELLEVVQVLLNQGRLAGRMATAHHRDFETMTDDDIRTWLTEIEFLVNTPNNSTDE